MKLKINETIHTEIEVELPYYVSNSSTYIKAEKEEGGFIFGITFSNYSASGIIRIEKGIIPGSWLLFQQITKEEFDAKFNELLKIIQDEIKN